MQLRKVRLAFTIAELLVSLLVVAVVAGLTYAVVGPAKEKARQNGCINNMSQIYRACHLYTNDNGIDNDGWFPGAELNANSLVHLARTSNGSTDSYGLTRDQFFCPDSPSWTKQKLGSTYTLKFARIDGADSNSENILKMVKNQTNATYEKLGDNFPMVICGIHDQLYYGSKNSDVHTSFASPFLIVLRLNGSVTARRESDLGTGVSILDPTKFK